MVRVVVFANRQAKEDNSCLFERFVEWNEDILFPFDVLVSSLRVLFGKSSIIVFEV